MANNTLLSLVDFATNTGRLAFETWGDSTVERSGGGHSVGFAKGLFGLVLCAGQLIPVNTTAAFNDTMGLIECRRRNNASTKVGAVNDIGVDTPLGYPVTFKQYGCQIPVPASTGYIGPQAAYMPGTIASGAVAIGGDVTATSVTGFPNSGRFKIDNEIVQYTSLVGNVFTGCSRGNLGTVAATHADQAVIGLCDNGAAISCMLSASKHPIGSGSSFIQSLFYLSAASPTDTAAATAWLVYDTQATPVNTDTTYTNKVAGSATALGNAAYTIGTLHRLDVAYTGSDLTNTVQVTLDFGTSATNGRGPAGPASFLYQGLFEANRPKGAIQSEGISQGGKTLNFLLKTLRNYDATNTVCEFDAGLTTRHKVMGADTTNGIAATALGGNAVAGWCQVACTGHNETSGSVVETALVDSAESWTINVQTTLGAAIADATTTAAITLTGTPASLGLASAGHILVGTERIIYTGTSGSTLTGITRGAYGTVGAAHSNGDTLYQGFLLQNPKGFCSDLLFDYKLKRASWIAAGGNASYFWYIWVRPIPVSATATAIADNTAISGSQAQQYAQKEYKFNQFVQTANAYLGTRDGFVVADMSTVYAGADALTYDLGVLPGAAGDQVHNSNATYEQAWHRMFANAGFRPGTGAIPSTGPTVGSGGVQYRGRNRGQGNF